MAGNDPFDSAATGGRQSFGAAGYSMPGFAPMGGHKGLRPSRYCFSIFGYGQPWFLIGLSSWPAAVNYGWIMNLGLLTILRRDVAGLAVVRRWRTMAGKRFLSAEAVRRGRIAFKTAWIIEPRLKPKGSSYDLRVGVAGRIRLHPTHSRSSESKLDRLLG